ncbi:MAG: hypothetical protein HYY31_02540 [Chloroflexi bacterium]|nr:hypothetical protein [Chloroflexota bacterium]
MSTFREVYDALRPTYTCADVRAVLLWDQGGWQNIFTVVHWTNTPEAEVIAAHNRLIDTYPRLGEPLKRRVPLFLGRDEPASNWLGIVLTTMPSNELNWLDVKENQRLVFRLPDKSYVLTSPYAHFLDKDSSDWPYGESEGWPFYRISLITGTSQDWGWLDAEARRLGFDGITGFGERILGQPLGQQYSMGLNTFLPVYAKLSPPQVDGQRLKITGRAHHALTALAIEGEIRGLPRVPAHRPPLLESLGPIHIVPKDLNREGIGVFQNELTLPEKVTKGQLDLTLYSMEKSRINLSRVKATLPSGDVSFKSFQAFVPTEDIDVYLDCLAKGEPLPKGHKLKSRDSNELLEDITQWLLALCCLPAIELSRLLYDVLRSQPTIGGADILVLLPENQLAVVGCQEAAVSDKDMNTLRGVRSVLTQRLAVEQSTVKAVIVSAKPAQATQDGDITVLGSDDLQKAWTKIKSGDLDGARQLFGLAGPRRPSV